MAILVECPKCGLRQPEKNKECGTKKGCGFQLKKGDGKVYWIEYYVDGQRKRERIGTSKKLAEMTINKRKIEIAEGRKLDKVKEKKVTLKELVKHYLEYSKQNKRSYARDVTSTKHLSAYFGNARASDITPRKIERYMTFRLSQEQKS